MPAILVFAVGIWFSVCARYISYKEKKGAMALGLGDTGSVLVIFYVLYKGTVGMVNSNAK